MTEVRYSFEHKDKRAKEIPFDNRSMGFIEGYACALQDLLYQVNGDNACGKSYDPLTCDEFEMHSYAFDMKDGGRHHPYSDYTDVREIVETLLKEAVEYLDD